MKAVTTKKSFFDLNDPLYFGHVFETFQKEVTDVLLKNYILSSYGFFAQVRILQMCRSLSRSLQSKKLFLFGSIFVHVLRAINLPRKFTRYRGLPAIDEQQIISHGHSFKNITQHFVQCQQPATYMSTKI